MDSIAIWLEWDSDENPEQTQQIERRRIRDKSNIVELTCFIVLIGIGLLIKSNAQLDFIRTRFTTFQLSPQIVPLFNQITISNGSLHENTQHATLESFPMLTNVNTFNDFINQTGRQYGTLTERYFRETLFTSRRNVVKATQKQFFRGFSSFELSLNPFADQTYKEFALLHGSKISKKGEKRLGKNRVYQKSTGIKDLPDSFDWRDYGAVNKPKLQGFKCASCYAFAVTAAIEGHIFRKTGNLIELSAQDLVDCAEEEGCQGCNGGYQDYAFRYIVENGISLDSKYPYVQMENAQCQHNKTGADITIKGFANIEAGNELAMKEIIATLGPIACSVNANSELFELYKSGIYMNEECDKDELNHSVAVVGYGNENGQDYWIIKNSYSENWGENGFMKMPRNNGSFCGIAEECSYPIID